MERRSHRLAAAVVLQATASDSVTTLVVQRQSTIDATFAIYRNQLDAAGYAIVKADNEGHEAELCYSLPGVAFEAIQMVRPRCPAGAVCILFSSSNDVSAGAASLRRS